MEKITEIAGVKGASIASPDSTAEPSQRMDLMKLYQEICTNIRTSDDISFKLLGFIPLVSILGSSTATLVLTSINRQSAGAVVFVSVVAAMITFGLFKWEMRNVQKCDELIRVAATLEKAMLAQDPARLTIDFGQYYQWKQSLRPPLFGPLPDRKKANGRRKKAGIGKTQAERIIYWTSIAAWFVPMIVAIVKWRMNKS